MRRFCHRELIGPLLFTKPLTRGALGDFVDNFLRLTDKPLTGGAVGDFVDNFLRLTDHLLKHAFV